MRMTRREMLASLAVAGLALKVKELKAAAPNVRIGACDWTLGKRTDPAALAIAKRVGLDGIMVDVGNWRRDVPLRKPELQKKYLEMQKQIGIPVSSLAIGTLNEIPLKSDPRAEQWLSDSVDVAKAMGLTVILVPFFGNGDLRNDKMGTDAVVAALKRVAPKAEKQGVILGLESWLSAEQHVDIMDRVGSPAVQVYYDVGNSQKAGYDIFKEIRWLGKRICEFHAKDNDDLYGKGTMSFPEVRRAMEEIGYSGWMQIEGTKMPLGIEASVRADLEYLRTIFPPQG
ncbi:MAG: sugar phosphate isomerase/epimerase family protein [Terriglobia bacterium]